VVCNTSGGHKAMRVDCHAENPSYKSTPCLDISHPFREEATEGLIPMATQRFEGGRVPLTLLVLRRKKLFYVPLEMWI
jgi:hypothetical protein